AAAATGSLAELAAGFDLVDEEEAGAGTATTPASRGTGTTVLLVEDEEQLRRVMKDLLEREGYTVAEARDGVQALDQVDRFAPDVIILDLNLPGIDGYTVLAQLRSRSATRTIPVVVLTAKGDEDNEVRVFELGADDFITKPFRAKALSARLEAVLGRHRA
ncbi:MAG TPA: response regulator, partial [Gemmatimonadales bacterium]